MNWNYVLFVVIGVAITFLVDYVKAGRAFKPSDNVPWYSLSLFVSCVLAYFIEEPVVQRLLLVSVTVAFIHVFKGLSKAGAGTPVETPYGRSVYVAKKGLLERIFGNTWFGWTVIFAFLSVLSFFQINSHWADVNNFNGILGWLGIGIVFGIAAILSLIMANYTSTGKGG